MTTLNLQVGASADDCHRRVVSLQWSLTWTTISAGDYNSVTYDEMGGIRFTGVTIGQGDTVDAATLQFRAGLLAGVIPTTYIEAEDVDDAATFSTAGDYTGRARTAAVSWTPGAWVDDTWYTTSELKTILQTVVDRASFAGAGVVFFWQPRRS